MILVDTSVWIDHLRAGNDALATLLEVGMVLAHPFVIGEVALGKLRQRRAILTALSDLPQAGVATEAEVLHVIDRHALDGCGIGYVDAHLLTSALLVAGTQLWTNDKRLHAVAAQLDLAVPSPRPD